MEICETSGLAIPIVPRLHQSSGYIKSKLGEWRAQLCNVIVGADTVLTSVGPQTTPFHGGQYRADKGNMPNFWLPILIVPRLNQSNGYIKSKLGEWKAQQRNAIVGADTVLTRPWPQTTLFHGVQHRAKNGNMPNFWPTNPHCTAFESKQWLHQK